MASSLDFVQSAISNADHAAFTSDNVAHNVLFCVQLGDTAGAVINDTAGNTNWVQIGATLTLAFGQGFGILWMCPDCLGGPNTVNLPGTTPGSTTMSIIEYLPSAAVTVDGVPLAVASVGATNSQAIGPLTTIQNDEVILYISGFLNGNADTLSGLGSLTIDSDLFITTREIFAQEPAPTPGPYSGGLTTSGGRLWANWLLAIEFADMDTFTISGNAGVAGAIVAYDGATSGTVTADGSGNYTTPPLATGLWNITPSLAGFVFNPSNRLETISTENLTGVDFTATPTGSPGGGGGISGENMKKSFGFGFNF